MKQMVFKALMVATTCQQAIFASGAGALVDTSSLIEKAEEIFQTRPEFYKPDLKELFPDKKRALVVDPAAVTTEADRIKQEMAATMQGLLQRSAVPVEQVRDLFRSYFERLAAEDFLESRHWHTTLGDLKRLNTATAGASAVAASHKKGKKIKYKKRFAELFADPIAMFNHEDHSPKMLSFVQKHSFPDGARILFIGDLHGSIHSLLRTLLHFAQQEYLNNDLTLKDNMYLVVLGDMVDRGVYGIDVVSMLLQLKLANWEKVFLLRGNHEDKSLTKKYGFKTELGIKYDDGANELYRAFLWMCSTLPLALFFNAVGDPGPVVQCCHGGIEPFYSPNRFLDAVDKKYDVLMRNTGENVMGPISNDTSKHLNYAPGEGFQWSDFTGLAKRASSAGMTRSGDYGEVWMGNVDRGFSMPGVKANPDDVGVYLGSRSRIKNIIRGHQDQFHCCKLIKPGKDYPVHWREHFNTTSCTSAANDGISFARFPVPITMSSAVEGQGNETEGYGLLDCVNGRYYIYENPVKQDGQKKRQSRGYVYVDVRDMTMLDDPANTAHSWLPTPEGSGISDRLKRLIIGEVILATPTSSVSLPPEADGAVSAPAIFSDGIGE